MILLEAYPQQVEPGTVVFTVVFSIVMFVLYALRKLPIFKEIWRLVVIFFLVLVGTVMWENIKKDIKDLLK